MRILSLKVANLDRDICILIWPKSTILKKSKKLKMALPRSNVIRIDILSL